MKKYKVRYTRESNMEWWSERLETVVEADTPEEAKKKIEDNSYYDYNYVVNSIEEIKDND